MSDLTPPTSVFNVREVPASDEVIRIDAEGFHYLGQFIADAGEAYQLLVECLRKQWQAPADGEVAELVAWLRGANWDRQRQTLATRAADLLERLSPPQPVPVSERLPGPVSDRQQQIEDLAADAVSALRYIEQSHGRLYGIGWDRVYEKADRLLPAHALPLPEVNNG